MSTAALQVRLNVVTSEGSGDRPPLVVQHTAERAENGSRAWIVMSAALGGLSAPATRQSKGFNLRFATCDIPAYNSAPGPPSPPPSVQLPALTSRTQDPSLYRKQHMGACAVLKKALCHGCVTQRPSQQPSPRCVAAKGRGGTFRLTQLYWQEVDQVQRYEARARR